MGLIFYILARTTGRSIEDINPQRCWATSVLKIRHRNRTSEIVYKDIERAGANCQGDVWGSQRDSQHGATDIQFLLEKC